MNINNLAANHILGYFALKKIEGDKPSNDFLKKLIDKYGTKSEQINFIINFKITDKVKGDNNFDLLPRPKHNLQSYQVDLRKKVNKKWSRILYAGAKTKRNY